jgi:S-DNA-T family DNA segregation ATPase FtsK/SpoIIIE
VRPVLGTAVRTLPAPPPPPALFPEPEPPPAVEPPAPDPPFVREFERVVSTPGTPSVGLAGTAEVPGDEPETSWVLPTPDLLDTVTGKRERLAVEVRATGETIVATLESFGIRSRIVGANSGPTVTQYELQPAVGVSVRKVVGAQTDLSLALAAPIRIQPFIPGKSAIGIEVPNKAAQLVSIKEVVQSPQFLDARHVLSVALGADVSGRPVVGDLTRMPHLLIAGATGSGKSVCINALLAGFLLQATPAQLKLILIDPKRVELSGFADVPHLLVPVVVEPEAAVASLRWAVKEMDERYKLFASHGARNLAAFNERAPELGVTPLPYIVVVIDELADLMMVAAGEIEDLICRIAQLARAVGIHLVVATQRPSADIITGLIKANIPSRIAFAVTSGVDSRVILDETGAEKLLGRGDMLYQPIDEPKPRRLQGAFVSDHELEALIGHWKAQGLPDYKEEIFSVEASVSWAREAGKRDPLFAKAAHTVAAEGRAAASLLQRKLNVGYTRAARLIDQLAEHRVVGPFEGSKSREVLMDVLQVDELLASLDEE